MLLSLTAYKANFISASVTIFLILYNLLDIIDSSYIRYKYTRNLPIINNLVISPLIYIARLESLNIIESDIFLSFFCGRLI
jgi:hypothetical protein